MAKAEDSANKTEGLQAEIKLRLAATGIDTAALKIEFRGSTAVLTGTVDDAEAHAFIVEALLAVSAVNRVVDALRVENYAPSLQIYMKQGEPLTRGLNDLFDPNVTWEEYRAAKKGIKLT